MSEAWTAWVALFLLPFSLAEQSRRRHRTPNRSHGLKSVRLNWFRDGFTENFEKQRLVGI
jgi:hypothetical protein